MFHMEHQEKTLIYNLSLEDLKARVDKPFRAKQIFNWLYHRYENSFSKFNNISKELQQNLSDKYTTDGLKIVSKKKSSDGSIKYLFSLSDNHTIETVFLKMRDKKLDSNGKIIGGEKYTICLSSQVGCKVGCSFCLTAKGGFVRDLTSGEIVSQVVELKKDNNLSSEKKVNIVFMGMGEPLDNLDSVVKSIDILTNKEALCISAKRITISTSGISPKIDRLGELNLGIHIAISLHATNNTLREKLIPMNRAYNIDSIIKAVKKFPIDNRKKVMFEYLLIKDLNDGLDSAKELIRVLDGIKAKVNLIYFNPFENSEFARPSKDRAEEFRDYLLQKGLLCTIRESKGLDIDAACGQLREKETKK
jgi:23S rRNA (adenine2503-C2)-methyltransferase